MEESSEGNAENADNTEGENKEGSNKDSEQDLEARVSDSSGIEDSKSEYKLTHSNENYSGKKSVSNKKGETSINNKSKLAAKIAKSSYSSKIERSNDGAVVLLVYENPNTGDVEFLFEEKICDYIYPSEKGKYGLMGGAIDIVNGVPEDSLEAAIREIREEIEDPAAKHILIHLLEQQRMPYGIITDYYEGYESTTYIYRVKINSREMFETIANSRSSDLAGPLRRVKLESFANQSIRKENFIFTQGEFMQDYVSKNYGVNAPKIHHNNHHSLIMFPTKSSQYFHSHLQKAA